MAMKKWIIVEDQDGPVMEWLNHLPIPDGSGLGALRAFWSGLLLEKFRWNETDKWGEVLPISEGGHLVGAEYGDLLVIYVRNRDEVEAGVQYLSKVDFEQSIAFLDWFLVDADVTNQFHGPLVTALAKSFCQLCVQHSSAYQDSSPDQRGTVKALGRRNPWYRVSNASMAAAPESVFSEAEELWREHNESFTGNRPIDGVLSVFANGVRQKPAPARGQPFSHEALERDSGWREYCIESWLVRQFKNGEDYGKALFMCHWSTEAQCLLRMKSDQRAVRKSLLDDVLRLLGAADWRTALDVTTDGWFPPFYPGIVFLCQVSLAVEAFRDPGNSKGENREPPTVTIGKRSVTFKFNTEVRLDVTNASRPRNVSERGNSTWRMSQLISGRLGWDAAAELPDAVKALEGILLGTADLVYGGNGTDEHRITW
jgi:hypothetical protein